MEKNEQHEPKGGENKAAPQGNTRSSTPWYAGPYKDALTYCMVAIFLVELIVGGVAFFYGLMHAVPDTPGGPPMARFPWLGWALAAVLAPVGLLLIVHLAGSWVAHMLGRENNVSPAGDAGPTVSDPQVPEQVERFYAIIRSAPTVVLLLGILLLGAALFFVDGAFSALMRLGTSLMPHIPWLAGSFAVMIATCYLVHRWFVYRHHRMQEEYAYRREVLERTGIVLVDEGCVSLGQNGVQPPALEGQVVMARALPPVDEEESPGDDSKAASEGDIVVTENDISASEQIEQTAHQHEGSPQQP